MISSNTLILYMGCLAHLASPILCSALPLSTRASPYQVRLVDTGTTFAEENNGVWQLIDATGDGIPDLVYIKTSSVAAVEVHIAAAPSFQTRILETTTTFAPETDGTWLMIPAKSGNIPDLAFIKTNNTSANKVEVHIASGASGYKTRTQETSTVFGIENHGTWSLYDYDGDGILDLVYIKTSQTGSNSVEVHVASGASTYQQFILHTGTTFAPENNGSWSLAPYSKPSAADLVYIKDAHTGTGTVEVHVASASSGYQTRIFEAGTIFSQEQNGTWSLIDYNKDGKLDLTYIKYKNTGSRTVEVHVASG